MSDHRNVCYRALHGPKISSPARKRFGLAKYAAENYRLGPVTEKPGAIRPDLVSRPTADTNYKHNSAICTLNIINSPTGEARGLAMVL